MNGNRGEKSFSQIAKYPYEELIKPAEELPDGVDPIQREVCSYLLLLPIFEDWVVWQNFTFHPRIVGSNPDWVEGFSYYLDFPLPWRVLYGRQKSPSTKNPPAGRPYAKKERYVVIFSCFPFRERCVVIFSCLFRFLPL